MTTLCSYYYFTLFICLSLFIAFVQSTSTFIVHVSKPHNLTFSASYLHHHYYTSILQSLPSSSPIQIIYSYTHSATGFAAQLTAPQAARLTRHPSVLSVIPDRTHQLHTTRTPEFLGLSHGSGLWPKADYASDIIIGVLDTGIWPNIPSFDDAGYNPVPATWKGSCDFGPTFPAGSCNRKIIGARAFYRGQEAAHGPINETKDSKSPLDTEGHGTHCASTAAGSVVPNANIFGYAPGSAGGVAYKARIAVYKVCWSSGCTQSDILAAIDQAIMEGVNVISLSVGSTAIPYFKDSLAIGTFHAAQRGVVVSVSAGNAGPREFTTTNVAPWMLTVGASTIDREFVADVVLGDGKRFKGVSLYDGGDGFNKSVSWGLVDGKDADSSKCEQGKLDASKVAAKIVMCERGVNGRAAKGYAVKLAGGAGMILVNTAEFGAELLADAHLIPATMVSYASGSQIKDYISPNSNPTATIDFQGTVVGLIPPSPRVAAFSSRGPNKITPEILKPDLVAPGVNILAGWTGFVGPSDLAVDSRRVQFNSISGTSMACPHVSGLAALLKNAHPSWSPSAIKSALMTTSYNLDNAGKNLIDLATSTSSTPFGHGSGQVDPNKALDPGLVYDSDANDYIAFLCSIGYTQKQISMFLKDPVTIDCGAGKLSSPGDLNYPSFAVVFESSQNVVKYTRKVTNVGLSEFAVYRVTVKAPSNVRVSVNPRMLVFRPRKPSLSYEISFTSSGTTEPVNGSSSFGSIVWSDGFHQVRSPIAVRWVQGNQKSLVASS
ncbi:subtilisin-like protease SBT1.4 [Silene latifolia]|uniref:subtilisin-like protease SBT1.4 n=1 Tax=Silene latifolia TaxID=37657 RepID=UPI003D787799